VTETDKADFAHDRRTAGRSSAAPALVKRILGCTSEGDSGAGFVLGHGGSWPSASAPFDAPCDGHIPLSGDERILRLSQLAALLSFLARIPQGPSRNFSAAWRTPDRRPVQAGLE